MVYLLWYGAARPRSETCVAGSRPTYLVTIYDAYRTSVMIKCPIASHNYDTAQDAPVISAFSGSLFSSTLTGRSG